MADLNDINNEIDRIAEAKGEIADAIRETGVEVPENARLGAYPPLIRRIPGTLEEIFWVEYGVTTASEIAIAITDGKLVCVRYSSRVYILTLTDANYYYFVAAQPDKISYLRQSRGNSSWIGGTNTFENTNNKVQTITDQSTADQYPSAKAVYDALPKDVVQYVEQTLTEAQKQQARTNIGATAPEIFLATYDTTTEAEINTALDSGKYVVCKKDGTYYPYVGQNSAFKYFGAIYANSIIYLALGRNNNRWTSSTLANVQGGNYRVSSIDGYEEDTTHYPNTKAVADALGKMGVVSQKQVWTQSTSGYDYTIRDVVRGIIPNSVIMEAENIGAVFNETTGYFELHELTDISWKEMTEILTTYPCGGVFSYSGGSYYRITKARTLAKIGNSSQVAILWAFYSNEWIETIISSTFNASNIASTFGRMYRLKTLKRFILAGITTQANIASAFSFCYSLENCELSNLKVSVSFENSSRLSLASVVYMVDNAANTSAITITLHATAYARCQADTTEYTYNGQTYTGIIAYAAARNISIVSA